MSADLKIDESMRSLIVYLGYKARSKDIAKFASMSCIDLVIEFFQVEALPGSIVYKVNSILLLTIFYHISAESWLMLLLFLVVRFSLDIK